MNGKSEIGVITNLKTPMVALLLGILAAAIVTFDPYLVNILPSGRANNVLKLYPYEFTSLLFLFILLLFISLKFFFQIRKTFEKSFIFIFLFSYHMVNLTRISVLEITDIVVAIFTFLFFIKVFMEGDLPIDKTLIMLSVALIFSILPSSINSRPFIFFASWIKACKMVLICLLLSACIYMKKNNIKYFVKWFIVLAVISSFIAIIQQAILLSTHYLFVGTLEPSQTKQNYELTSIGLFYRFSGFVAGYKVFSNILILALMLIWNLFLYEKTLTNKKKALLIVSSALMIIALIFTFSKDALLVFSLGVIFSLLLKRPYLLLHLLAIFLFLFAVCIVTGILEDIYRALATEFEIGEFRMRKQFLREGLYGFVYKHPWIGVGIEQSKLYTAHFYRWPPHNGFLVALDEAGILGLLVFLLILGYTLHKTILLSKMEHGLPYKWIVRGFFAGFVCFIITINFHPTYMDNMIWIYVGVINGMYRYFTNKQLD